MWSLYVPRHATVTPSSPISPTQPHDHVITLRRAPVKFCASLCSVIDQYCPTRVKIISYLRLIVSSFQKASHFSWAIPVYSSFGESLKLLQILLASSMDLGSLHTANFCLFVLVIVLFETTILDSSVLAVVLGSLDTSITSFLSRVLEIFCFLPFQACSVLCDSLGWIS